MRLLGLAGVAALFTGVAVAQGAPVFLAATPSTVAWGYYWAKAKPVLTVHSGDTVRIQTLSTCGPNDRLEEEGVKAADIPAYNQPIFDQVKDKGPGGHILTGPVAIDGAEPGDVLEVDILKIDIDAPFACNGFGAGRGFLPDEDDRALWAGDRYSAASVFRQHGRCAAGVGGTLQQRAAVDAWRQHGQQGTGGGDDALFARPCEGRVVRGG
jgi:acetamidase/formamidase